MYKWTIQFSWTVISFSQSYSCICFTKLLKKLTLTEIEPMDLHRLRRSWWHLFSPLQKDVLSSSSKVSANAKILLVRCVGQPPCLRTKTIKGFMHFHLLRFYWTQRRKTEQPCISILSCRAYLVMNPMDSDILENRKLQNLQYTFNEEDNFCALIELA